MLRFMRLHLLHLSLLLGLCTALEKPETLPEINPPNVLIFLVDDLGWNQLGYHARESGNDEIKTPFIDDYVQNGIDIDRGYMTPWCGPSRAAIQTGRTNSYNENITQNIYVFDDDIGFVAGLPPGTSTLATAFKAYGKDIGRPYKAYYNGKWGIGGTAWTNTPMGMGYDEFRGFWGTGIEDCDGLASFAAVPPYHQDPFILFDNEFGPLMLSSLPGYWEQNPDFPDPQWCPYIQSQNDRVLSPQEKFLACKTQPRTPPRHVDLDLLDKVVDQIETHDYSQGSWLQVFATSAMHSPLSYPKEYNEQDPEDLPEYFQDGNVKPVATQRDMRLATNRYVRFMDFLFGSTMKAIKDAGQWDNTIVYFTSDNGGANYGGTAQNNYPLRGGKFSVWEGATRVTQFMTGGWIDNNLTSDPPRKSGTYVFPSDIGPTLLEMAGADKSYLIQDKTGAVYGNALWEYIKNSVDGGRPTQKSRKVSFGPKFFFDVGQDRTLKKVYTGLDPQWTPRLWSPTYPTNEDLLMDVGYRSVKPCRPGGAAWDCCIFDIEADFQETNPLAEDCSQVRREGKEIFVIDGGCPRDLAGRHTNPICVEAGQIDEGALPQTFALWSHYRAGGPFTNSVGHPIGTDLNMKCVCDFVDEHREQDGLEQEGLELEGLELEGLELEGLELEGLEQEGSAAVDYFTPTLFSPPECFKSNPSLLPDKLLKIPCDGTFAFTPQRNELGVFESQGFDLDLYTTVKTAEHYRLVPVALGFLHRNMITYIRREGFTEWPNVGKNPFLYKSKDSCAEKRIALVPWPDLAFPPYFYSQPDPTIPFDSAAFLGLCMAHSPTDFFCPTYQNPLLTPVVRWHHGDVLESAHAILADGTKWKAMGLVECLAKCKATPEGSAYIGDGPLGLVVGNGMEMESSILP